MHQGQVSNLPLQDNSVHIEGLKKLSGYHRFSFLKNIDRRRHHCDCLHTHGAHAV